MPRLILALTALLLCTPVLATAPYILTIPCKQNTAKGSVLWDHRVEPENKRLKLLGYRVSRVEDDMWTSGECRVQVRDPR